ncbi:MAG TPA: hypothetical protein VMW38_27285 [Terriglobia bacterium]|nr:hypothetical protein [Terriglobia bacterium]
MPYSTELKDGGKGILHVASGIVTGEELLASASRMLGTVKEGLSPSYAIVDLSEVVELRVSAEEIRLNADINIEISKYVRSGKVAIVAPRDYIYGIARMWQAYSEGTGWITQVFRSKAEAVKWIEGTEKGRM